MNALKDLAGLVTAHSGMQMGPRQMGALAAALRRMCEGDAARVLDAAIGEDADPGILQRVLDELTVKETFFLREAGQLAAIDWSALLDDARRTGSGYVHVWSAACATGEEPYTLAMLAAEALGEDRRFVRILGTDIATVAVSEARRGRYHARAVRNVDPALRSRHFSREGDAYVVAPHLLEMVEIRRHNLAGDELPDRHAAPFDLILCRNVLIYFQPAVAERVIRLLEGGLRSGGTLLLGAADRLCVTRSSLEPASRLARPARDKAAARRASDSRRSRRAASDTRSPSPRRTSPVETRRPAVAGTSREERDSESPLVEAVRFADLGRLEEAVEAASMVLDRDSMNAPAHFVCGSAQLALGQADVAVGALKRALYVDGTFAMAAFQLGRAYDALGRGAEGRQAYRRALRTFDPDDDRHGWLLGRVDIGDLAAACRMRLAVGAPVL